MRLTTVEHLLDFDGSVSEALFVDSRSTLIDQASQLVAWARAQHLLELVNAEVQPARERASEAKEKAGEAKIEWERLLGLLRDCDDKTERDELRRRYNQAEQQARELDMSAKLAGKKSQQLPWLVESLKTIERPDDLDALEILKEVLK